MVEGGPREDGLMTGLVEDTALPALLANATEASKLNHGGLPF